ncbi:hypothetical protein T492DRAFT_872302 [Pavlovales sp. CCMP2436]|nr:hypothetical protein T492DRAFT_872302 [Pavlovales sp. CCMP2436]
MCKSGELNERCLVRLTDASCVAVGNEQRIVVVKELQIVDAGSSDSALIGAPKLIATLADCEKATAAAVEPKEEEAVAKEKASEEVKDGEGEAVHMEAEAEVKPEPEVVQQAEVAQEAASEVKLESEVVKVVKVT